MTASNQVVLRPATAEDISLMRRWENQPHLQSTIGDDDWEWETEFLRNPPWREQLIAEVDGIRIGFIQIIDPAEEDGHYWGEVEPNLRAIDIWIGETAYLNRGFGTQMMQQALVKCFEPGEVKAVLIDPLENNSSAHRFYKRLGFTEMENCPYEIEDCLVLVLERNSYLALSVQLQQ